MSRRMGIGMERLSVGGPRTGQLPTFDIHILEERETPTSSSRSSSLAISHARTGRVKRRHSVATLIS